MSNLRQAAQRALEALESSRRSHHYCEDTWYSCPKHEGGCANEAEGDECNCGADKANEKIDQAITAIEQALAEPEQKPVAWYFNQGLKRGVSLKQESPEWMPLYTALRAALAEPEQPHDLLCVCGAEWDIYSDGREELVAAPTPRKPLSEQELDAMRQADGGALNFVTLRAFRVVARAVEAAHGITGETK